MKYVALLRGINVGGNKKVEMKKLAAVFTELGYADVRTYINSGNVIFSSPKKDFAHIEPALKHAFGFPIEVIVRDAKNIASLVQKIPKEWGNDTKQRTDVIFLWEGYDSKRSLTLIKQKPVDTLVYIDGAIVWNLARKNVNKSGMRDFIGTEVYKHMTARNINTVRKLSELLS
jgi:uncharacterized protein (DUF1697 family)